MTRADDPWRLPALERLGAQLRDAERADRDQPAPHPGRRRPLSLRAAPLIVALALIAAALELVTPAGAVSPINHAPTAAAQSRSVRFSSEFDVTVNGGRLTRLTEQGELDFATGDYATTLNWPSTGEHIEKRRVGGMFYGLQFHSGALPSSERWRAIRIAQRRGESMPAPGGYTLMDPQVIFRVLAGSRSPVSVVGHEQLEGAATTHYRLSATLAAFLAAEQESATGVSAYNGVAATLDVWLDGKGRPRRVEASFAGASRLGEARMSTLVDFTDYGAAVTVRAPSHATVSTRSNVFSTRGEDPTRVLERVLFAGR